MLAALVLFVVILSIVYLTQRYYQNESRPIMVRQKIESCEQESKMLDDQGKLTKENDRDSDGLLNSCDPCPDTPNLKEGETRGEYSKDEDGDGIPSMTDDKNGEYKLCCVKGVDQTKIDKDPNKYCETEENDKEGEGRAKPFRLFVQLS